MKKKLKYKKPHINLKKLSKTLFMLRKNSIDSLDLLQLYGVNSDLYALRSHNYSSDKRLKKNIRGIKKVVDKLSKLRVVTFEWKKTSKDNNQHRNQIGIIAQNLEKIFPQFINKDLNGYKTIDYGQLSAVLIKAIQELENENKLLRKRMKLIEAKVN